MAYNTANSISQREVMGMFFNRLSQDLGMSWVNTISMLFQSNQDIEKYPWLGQTPMMREWIGGRHAKILPENVLTIENLHYELTEEFLVKDLRRDKTGQIQIRINEMAYRANVHWAYLLSELINSGHSDTYGLSYDGQYFFDTDHVTGDSGTQSNDTTVDISELPVSNSGSTTTPSAAEMSMAIMLTIQKIIGYKDDTGQPMNELARNFQVQVPIGYWQSAVAGLGNRTIDGGDDNTAIAVQADGFRINLSTNVRLTETDTFFVFNSDGTTSPFIRQEETGIMMKVKGAGSDYEFNNDAHQYGIDTWRNAGYGRWEKACRTQLI